MRRLSGREFWLARIAGMEQKAENFIRGAWRWGIMSDNVLRAAKPRDIPLKPATRFHTVVNIKTAKALHLDIPVTAHASVYEVIE
jgi:hypothetical protein